MSPACNIKITDPNTTSPPSSCSHQPTNVAARMAPAPQKQTIAAHNLARSNRDTH